ncbi:hypothetical protein [Roseateles sp. NT4]|uniref:hypothetical protein n=1 Tax=Roseateles sp. NT4 TaxID=3453715 RepID=UPI003F730C1B
MAAWQFEVTAVFGHGGQALPPPVCRRAQTVLAESFEPPWQMLKGWSVYGSKNGNRIDLIIDEDGTGELSARIDARSDADSFLTRWLILMMELNCSQYAPELNRAFPADMVSLKDALQSSSAWRYALATP